MRLLDLAAAGVPGAAWIWKEWRRAIHGHTLVTGLADICKRLKVTDEDARAWLQEQRRRRELELEREGKPVEKVRPLNITFRAHLFETALAIGLPRVFEWVDKLDAANQDKDEGWIQSQLDEYLWSQMATARRPSCLRTDSSTEIHRTDSSSTTPSSLRSTTTTRVGRTRSQSMTTTTGGRHEAVDTADVRELHQRYRSACSALASMGMVEARASPR